MGNGLPAPIFVTDAEEVDVFVFRSVAEAEGFIELPDVVAGDVVAFDRLGRRLSVGRRGRRTVLSVSEGAQARDPYLVTAIRRLADAAALPIDRSPDDWDSFVESAARAIGAWMQQ